MDAASFGENTYALRRLRAFLDQVCTRYFDQPTNRKGTHPPLPHVQMYADHATRTTHTAHGAHATPHDTTRARGVCSDLEPLRARCS
jgi:hypothetical protein